MRRLVIAAILPCLAAGCGHAPRSSGVWGEGATLSPGWAAARRAAVEAAADPYTWMPVVAAAVLQAGDADAEIADELRRETPLFGSTAAADEASDWLRLGAVAGYAVLGLAAPGPDEPERPWWTRAHGLLVGTGALGATAGLTSGFKAATDRTRPDGSDDRSMPSGHASSTAAAARLAADALDYYPLTTRARRAAGAGLIVLTGVEAWSRVEAGAHYPSDVLVGAALGNFVAQFATRAFLHPASAGRVGIGARLLPGGALVSVYAAY